MSVRKDEFVDFLETYLMEEEAKELEITITGDEEHDAPMIDSRDKANYFLKLMMNLKSDIDQINAICDAEIAKTTQRVEAFREEQLRTLTKQYEYYEKILKNFTEHEIANSKKKSIQSQPVKWEYNDEALLEWAKKNAPQLVNVKTTESVIKNDLKANVEKDGNIVKLEGKPVEGVNLVEQPPKFSVKIK